jgi:dihydrodipicolinate synthase/N-acetylneuraminate lyase
VAGTLELIAYAARVGFDAALVPLPSLLRAGRASKEILSSFRAVADASEMPVVLDSGAAGDGELSVEAAIELAQHPNVIGMLDASADASRVSEVLKGTTAVRHDVTVTMVFAAVTRRMLALNGPAGAGLMPVEMLSGGGTALSLAPVEAKPAVKTRVKTVGFQFLCGRTAGVLDALIAGAVGAVPPLAAAAPQACYEVLAAWKDGDPALAADKQDRLRVLAARVEDQLGVPGIKYGCDLNGYFGGRPRLPVLPLTGAERGD